MNALSQRLIDAIQSGRPLDGPLRELVSETQARAAGCWRLHDNNLELIGFGAADDMDSDVDLGFRDATRRVALDQLGLGIVKAAVSRKPAIGHRDPAENGLTGSASWIVRFQANTSLAVPIQRSRNGEVVGVLAVSTADVVHPDHPVWSLLHEFADQLSEPMENSSPS